MHGIIRRGINHKEEYKLDIDLAILFGAGAILCLLCVITEGFDFWVGDFLFLVCAGTVWASLKDAKYQKEQMEKKATEKNMKKGKI